MPRLLLAALAVALAAPAAAQVVPADAVTHETAVAYARASGTLAGLRHACGFSLEAPAFAASARAKVRLMDPTALADAEAAYGAGAASITPDDCGRSSLIMRRLRADMAASQRRWFDHIIAMAPGVSVHRWR